MLVWHMVCVTCCVVAWAAGLMSGAIPVCIYVAVFGYRPGVVFVVFLRGDGLVSCQFFSRQIVSTLN